MARGIINNTNPLPRPEMFDKRMIIPPPGGMFAIQEYTRADKIKRLIHRCVECRIEIPAQWVEEYNGQCSTTDKE